MLPPHQHHTCQQKGGESIMQAFLLLTVIMTMTLCLGYVMVTPPEEKEHDDNKRA